MTTVEGIGSAAGIALRTFSRYCAAKEDAPMPVLTPGVGQLIEDLATRPVDEPLTRAVQAAFETPAAARRLADPAQVRRLVRATATVPAIRMRGLAAGRDMQGHLLPVLAARKGASEDSMEVRPLAGALTNALSVGMEYWARQDEPGDVVELTQRALGVSADRRVVARRAVARRAVAR